LRKSDFPNTVILNWQCRTNTQL